jgi:hypothetical protein
MRSTSPGPRPERAGSARRLPGRRRLAIVAGLSALLLVVVAGAASAGAFPGRSHPVTGSGHLSLRASARAEAIRSARANRADHSGGAAGADGADGAAGAAGAGSAAGAAGANGASADRAATGYRSPGAVLGAGPASRDRGDGRTSCTAVAHIGDSTSVGMVSPATLPDPELRLTAQYYDVGVRSLWISASGGRSIVEHLPDQLDGYRVATDWYRAGYRGCWVIALGTNDAADVAVGSDVGDAARIGEMMAAVHGEPVMWVNTQTDDSDGPWSEANMRLWNAALVAACAAYPNMRIFNWAAMVRPAWHLADGIHYTAAGYAIRAHAIARALARAFPANKDTSGCLVR